VDETPARQTTSRPVAVTLRQALLAAAFYGAVLVVLFHKVIFSGHMLLPLDILHEVFAPWKSTSPSASIYIKNRTESDAISEFYPYAQHAYRVMKEQHRMPLWISAAQGGTPLLANSVEGLLNPFHATWAFMPFEKAWNYEILLQLFCAGVFMYLLARQFGIPHVGGLVAGLAYMLNSMFAALLLRGFLTGGFVWVPIVLLFLDRYWQLDRRRDLAGIAVAFAFCHLGGCLQTSLYAGLAYLAFVWCGWRQDVAVRERGVWRRLMSVGGAALLGIGVAAIQIVPTVELLRLNQRELGSWGGSDWSVAHAILSGLFWASFAFPRLAGSPDTLSATEMINAGMTYFQGYIGFLPLACAVFAAVCMQHRLKPALLTLAGVSLAVTLTPLVTYLYYRIFILFIFAASILAGMGFTGLTGGTCPDSLRRYARRVGWVVVAYILLLVLTTTVLTAWGKPLSAALEQRVSPPSESVRTGLPSEWYRAKAHAFLDGLNLTKAESWPPTGIVLASWGILWLVATRPPRRRRWVVGAALAIMAADLGYYALTWVPIMPLQQYPLYPDRPSLRSLQADRGVFRVWPLTANKVETPVGYRYTLLPYGLEVLVGFDSMFPRTAGSLLGNAIGLGNDGRVKGAPLQQGDAIVFPEPVRNLLNLLNVKYVMTNRDRPARAEGFSLVYDGEVKIYRNDAVFPRAFMAHQYQLVEPGLSLTNYVCSPAWTRDRKVLLDRPPSIASESAGDRPERAELTRHGDREVVVTTESPSNGILVLSETFYPGWKASVDGVPAPIMRAFYALKAVAVPRGKHTVRFVYDPFSFKLGVIVTAVSLLGVVGCLVAGSANPKQPFDARRVD
jgi:hypothetical protein